MRPAAIVVLGLCVASLSACRTSDRAGVRLAPAAEPIAPASAGIANVGAGLTLHAGPVYKVALSGDGTVWGVRHQDGSLELARWADGTWKKVEGTASWPRRAEIVELAADPSTPTAILSVWKPIGDGLRTLLVKRHVAGEAAGVLLGEVENPTFGFAYPRTVAVPRVTFDAEGGVWFTFKAPYLVHLPAGGGEPRKWDLPAGQLSEPQRRHYSPLVYTPEGTGRGWVWAWIGANEAKHADLLKRPLLLQEGRLRNDYVLAGLPADAQVTFVNRSVAQETVWAVENEGLWEIDETGGVARRRSSPPGSRIIDWCQPTDGLEVAVVVPKERRTDGSITEIWIRKDGEWRWAGPTGVGSHNLTGTPTSAGGLFGWTWRDGMLFAAGLRGLSVVDMTEEEADAYRVRTPDWREGFYLDRVFRILHMKDGAMMIHGEGGVVTAEPGALRPVAAGAAQAGASAVFMFTPYGLRAADGRLWYAHTRGEGAPMVRHWDGERWHEWPLPDEYQTAYAYGGIWADELGRVALFPKINFDHPAWERDIDAPGGWRRWQTGWLLIENRARSPEKAANAPHIRRESRDFPAISPDGRALVAHRGALRLWENGEWRTLATYPNYVLWWRWGFGEDGRPWTVFNDKRHVFDADGTRHETPATPDKYRNETKVGDWPDWLSRRLDRDRALAAHQDAEGVWWVLQDRELWKGWRGEVVQVFQPDEVSPFRRATQTTFVAVYVGRRGERLFECNSPVLLPQLPEAGTPRLTWAEGATAADRRIRIEDGGFTYMEWRLDEGSWRMEKIGDVELLELEPRAHVLDMRFLNRRLEPGPILREEFQVVFDTAAHVSGVMQRLHANAYTERAAAVGRLRLMGRRALPWIEESLATETDESRRWWLRAALQAIADRTAESTPSR